MPAPLRTRALAESRRGPVAFLLFLFDVFRLLGACSHFTTTTRTNAGAC